MSVFKAFIVKLWPISREENKKFIPMLIMLFLLSFNQSALWNMKDSLVITTSGAAVIPFIKFWAILPSVVFLTWIYTFLSNRFTQEKIFYILTGSFLTLYALFAFLIYPHRDQLHPFESAAYLDGVLPLGFKGLISLYRYWTFTGFYVVCELWNTVIISMLFWGFANSITLYSEGGRFYSVLSIAYNGAIIVAGVASLMIAENRIAQLGPEAWEQTMQLLMLVIITSGLLTIAIFRWMHRGVVREDIRAKKEKSKLTLTECLRYVSKSKYLICMSVMVVAFGVSFNLFEVVWKEQLRTLYPETIEYNHYMNILQVVQGAVAMVLSLGMVSLVKRLGWTKLALATPVFLLGLSLLFFGVLFFQDTLSPAFLGMSPLMLGVFIGSLQNCVGKGLKYSLFDATKEMAFIPLSQECKLKGKTAIDGIGARLGKSGGSLVHQGLLILFASLSASAPYVALIMLVALVFWILSTRVLGRHI